MILVSACLLNLPIRYKGDGNLCSPLLPYAASGQLLPFCPEAAGGLPTPRPPAEISGGTGLDVWRGCARVVNDQGEDVTDAFKQGARLCAEICRRYNISAAILKQRSPSCGSDAIYDGSFQGRRIPGMGVTAALLMQQGVKIYSEEDVTEELLQKLFANG